MSKSKTKEARKQKETSAGQAKAEEVSPNGDGAEETDEVLAAKLDARRKAKWDAYQKALAKLDAEHGFSVGLLQCPTCGGTGCVMGPVEPRK